MRQLFSVLFRAGLSTAIAGLCAILVIILYTNARLPSVDNLEDVKLQIPLKIYTADGKLIGEYGEKRRKPVDIKQVPEKLKLALLATEDRRFYEHNGVDLRGLIRAAVRLITRGTKEQGASTITMQVARNFFLSRKKTFSRKLNEILLALKIEKELTKDQILELYLNKVYFGKRAYGVSAAAEVYYGLELNELNLAQMSMIAGLPQAPSAVNPINNPKRALKRREHVLNRMLHYGFITEEEYENARSTPLSARYHSRQIDFYAPYVAEIARQEVVNKYGRQVYTKGFKIYTTVNSQTQKEAQEAVQSGLLEYDKRHGFRGPIKRITLPEAETIQKKDAENYLKDINTYPKLIPTLIIEVNHEKASGILKSGQKIEIPFSGLNWASKQLSNYQKGPKPNSPQDVLERGDIVYVEPSLNHWRLSQVPEASAALVAINPQNGAIEAIVGGYDFRLSNFNRATQAHRQPGSNFKPFVYSAALESGYTAASIINDAPVVFNDPTLEGVWRPQNDTRKFYGPTRLRVGLTKSRNLVSIRLLQAVGIKKTLNIVEKFGFNRSTLPYGLSLALGTAAVTPLNLASSYAVFANGGYKVNEHLIKTIVDSEDEIIFDANKNIATVPDEEESTEPKQISENENDETQNSELNAASTSARRVISAQTAYIMSSMLQDAIQTGTGRGAKVLKRDDIAGKTGTTNNQFDAWYSGYHPKLVTTVWVGFDEPKSLKEYGSQAALPIWIKFMDERLDTLPKANLNPPTGLVAAKIDPETGLLARPGQSNAIFEVFRAENVPTTRAPQISMEPKISITPSGQSSSDSLF